MNERLQIELKNAIANIPSRHRVALGDQVAAACSLAFDKFISARTHKDNLKVHEYKVSQNFGLIAQTLRLGESDTRIGYLFCAFHDSHFRPRVTEAHIDAEPDEQKKEELRKKKARLRMEHMAGGARNAKAWLPLLGFPTTEEIAHCVSIIALHDTWKLAFPWPASYDLLSVACVEADALYPIQCPEADLQRDNGPDYAPSEEELTRMAARNYLGQLCTYRKNFECTSEVFQDEETIVRTEGGKLILDAAIKARPGFWECVSRIKDGEARNCRFESGKGV